MSTPKLITFLPNSLFYDERNKRWSNPVPHPVWKYLSESKYLFNLTAPNKQSFNVKSESKSRDHLITS